MIALHYSRKLDRVAIAGIAEIDRVESGSQACSVGVRARGASVGRAGEIQDFGWDVDHAPSDHKGERPVK